MIESQTSYKRVLGYASHYKSFFLASIVGFMLFAAMEAVLIKTLEFFFDRLENRESEAVFFLSSTVTSSVFFVPVAIIVLSIVRGIGQFLGNFFLGLIGIHVVNNFRRDVFSHMAFLPQRFFDGKNSGELLSLLIYNIEQVAASVTDAVKILFRDGLQVIFFLCAMLLINWKVTLIFLGAAPAIGIIIYFASQYFRKVSHRIQDAIGKVSHIATESIQGIKLVKSFGGENYEIDRFKHALKDNLTYSSKFLKVNAFQTPLLHFMLAIALAIVFYVISMFWEGNSSSAIVFAIYAGAIAKPFRQLSKINSLIQKGLAAADTIFNVLDMPREKDDGKKSLANVNGEITFNNVSFGYSDKVPAISKIQFNVARGQSVALVGGSGSGKTTIVNLLLRFYDAQEGEITIDGVPISSVSLKSLRENIALVNQQTILFNDTIMANISYGSPSNDNIEARVLDAAATANAHDFITELPDGYNTLIGEDGARLSGGQRQRLAIARALFKDAPILILDEATSALDNESEKLIQDALDRLKKGRTTITIAHRLSTIEQSDVILVLETGRIVEAGTHSDLLCANGAYANLYQSQFTQPSS